MLIDGVATRQCDYLFTAPVKAHGVIARLPDARRIDMDDALLPAGRPEACAAALLAFAQEVWHGLAVAATRIARPRVTAIIASTPTT